MDGKAGSKGGGTALEERWWDGGFAAQEVK